MQTAPLSDLDYAKMIYGILKPFRDLFSDKRAYEWYLLAIVAFIVRLDHNGITSLIRALDLPEPDMAYVSLLHFFHANSWDAQEVSRRWCQVLKECAPLQRIHNRIVLIADGIKVPKEGLKMPGVKKMKQESENSRKGEYVFGHLFGALSILIERSGENNVPEALYSMPLKMAIQDGIRELAKWEGGEEFSNESHVLQVIQMGFDAALQFGGAYLTIDRYFLTVPALVRLNTLNAEHEEVKMHIVTKAKSNCVAYEKPVSPEIKGRGAPRKKGNTVKLASKFADPDTPFQKAAARCGTRQVEIEYYSEVLLWGKELYQELRFVLIRCDGMTEILACTDTSLTPVEIFELYHERPRIESMFRVFNSEFGGFDYHFWTSVQPELNHYRTKDSPDPYRWFGDEEKEKILNTLKAIGKYVQLVIIAMGITQLIAIREPLNGLIQSLFYLRTGPREKVSEAAVRAFLQKWLVPEIRMADNPPGEALRKKCCLG